MVGEDQFGCAHALRLKASFNLVNTFCQFKILWIQQFELFHYAHPVSMKIIIIMVIYSTYHILLVNSRALAALR